jgi:hypothetical protein
MMLNLRRINLMTVMLEEQKNLHSQRAREQTERRKTISKPLATIQVWAVVEGVVSQHFARLQAGNCLRGHVLGLAHLSYAQLVHISPILKVDLAEELVETRNTIYRLGEVSEEYDSWRAAAY